MPVLMGHGGPGGTPEQYEAVGDRVTGGRGSASLEDWPVEGILSHAAGPTEDGCVLSTYGVRAMPGCGESIRSTVPCRSQSSSTSQRSRRPDRTGR